VLFGGDTMESEEEIKNMTVVELKEFFARHEVPLSTIPTGPGYTRPLKVDMTKFALLIRAEYDAARNARALARNRATTPAKAQQNGHFNEGPNIFQQTSPSPGKSSREGSANKATLKQPVNMHTPQGTRVTKTEHHSSATPAQSARRKSVGWAAPEIFTPSSKAPISSEGAQPYAPHYQGSPPIRGPVVEMTDPRHQIQFYPSPPHQPTILPKYEPHRVQPSVPLAAPNGAFPPGAREALQEPLNQEPAQYSTAPLTQAVPEQALGEVDLSLAESEPENEKDPLRRYKSMKVTELRALLKAKGVVIDTRMRKVNLIALLRGLDMAAENETESPAPEEAAPLEIAPHAESSVHVEAQVPGEGAGSRPESAFLKMLVSPRAREADGLHQDSLRGVHRVLSITSAVVLVAGVIVALCSVLLSGPVFCASSLDSQVDHSGCVPCPEHAICSAGAAQCVEGFQLVGQRCVEQRDTALAAAWVAERMLLFIRERRGLELCGFLRYESGGESESESSGVDAKQLSSLILEGKHGALPSWMDGFSEKKRALVATRAVTMLLDLPGIEQPGKNSQRVSVSDELALRPLKCVVSGHVRRFWAELLLISALILSAAGCWVFVLRRRAHDAWIDQLVEDVMRLLREQREEADTSSNAATVAYVADTHLRDEVLGRIRDPARRSLLWASVVEHLEGDSRVIKKGPKMIHGVPCFVWEWCARTTPSKRPDFTSPFTSSRTEDARSSPRTL